MAISKTDLDRLFELERSAPDDSSLACLAEPVEVFGFLIAQARAEPESGSEEDLVELLVRSLGLAPHEVRKLEKELRRFGYTAVSDRLKAIAGRRKHELAPLLPSL